MPGSFSKPLSQPVNSLRGVGPERALLLARLGIHTVEDLLLHRPRRYEDRRQFRSIRELQVGELATVRGVVSTLGVKRWHGGARSVFELVLEDGTGRLHCRWWNQPFMEGHFERDQEWLVCGKVKSLRPRSMDHPETERMETGEETAIHLNRIVPVYPLTDNLSQRFLRTLTWGVLAEHGSAVADPWPAEMLADLPTRAEALQFLHFPATEADPDRARTRLALDELISLQLEIQRRRHHLQAHATALPCAGDNRLIRPFLRRLGFSLTAAQTRVLREIRQDLGGRQPMRRLLQGDVGSGKTVVAAAAALMTLESGYAVTLMAPTEILADQHYATFQRWFAPLGIPVHLQTAHRKTLRGLHAEPKSGRADGEVASSSVTAGAVLVIGTHALIESEFVLDRLGLVIIDEQHRFGVAQRERLVRKGWYPHLMVMTATPIPRTLGLTLYGDLDLSVIDALPPGRGEVKTHVRSSDRLTKVWSFVREELTAGRQVYVVYPRIEEAEPETESDVETIKNVRAGCRRLRLELSPFRVEMLHGQLPADQKESVMNAFREGRIHVLVATSVIEVGVDVPNATIMVVENADRFGLAQLHQLRGRIGRGAHQSHCILVADRRTPAAESRLRVLEQSHDGFRIAEEDLLLRGPGELLGREQSGLPPFRFADLARDLPLVERARTVAQQILHG
jgi:ATP-dependent DNA helicase RecG